MDEARHRCAEREAALRRCHEGMDMAPQELREVLAALAVEEKGEDYAVEIFEPTLERLTEHSIVTRNRYGAEVLNTTELCFVDVDAVPRSLWDTLAAIFGAQKRSSEQRLMADLQRLCASSPGLSARLYRTAGGWRVILAGEGVYAGSPQLAQLYTRLHADELYVHLCKKQGCWRARLTPKPSRLGCRPGRYPRRSSADSPAEGEAEWLARYAEGSAGVGVCRLVESFGRPLSHPLVAWHDERTAALKDGLSLA